MEDLQDLIDRQDSEELVRLGTEYFRNGDETAAFECYRAACKLGNAVAMGNLGYCYQTGRGVKASTKLAAYCFERASELDDPGSTLKLGDFYYRGKADLPKDPARAVAYYRKAFEIASSQAERDDFLFAEICLRLAVCKKDGCGTEQNYEDAYEYFQAVAEITEYDAQEGHLRAEKLFRRAQEGMNECEAHF